MKRAIWPTLRYRKFEHSHKWRYRCWMLVKVLVPMFDCSIQTFVVKSSNHSINHHLNYLRSLHHHRPLHVPVAGP